MLQTTLVIKRVLPASPERVFRAWSEPRLMAKWFFAEASWNARATNDFRVGGSYQIEMLEQENIVFIARGEYREIVANAKLVFTWNSPTAQDTLVTVELRSQGESTELTLTHWLPPDEEVISQHTAGWKVCLNNQSKFLSSRS